MDTSDRPPMQGVRAGSDIKDNSHEKLTFTHLYAKVRLCSIYVTHSNTELFYPTERTTQSHTLRHKHPRHQQPQIQETDMQQIQLPEHRQFKISSGRINHTNIRSADRSTREPEHRHTKIKLQQRERRIQQTIYRAASPWRLTLCWKSSELRPQLKEQLSFRRNLKENMLSKSTKYP